MKQQTAVEWLIEQIKSDAFCDHIQGFEYWDKDTLIEFLEKAKQMEKEQHGTTWDKAIDAHEKRGHVIARSWCDFDEYYNEKFVGGGNTTTSPDN